MTEVQHESKESIDPNIDLLDVTDACKMLGGSRPINPATYYRGVKQGTYPKPIKIGCSSRVLRREIVAFIEARIAERDAKPVAA